MTIELRLDGQAIVTRVGPFAADALRAELDTRPDDGVGARAAILDTRRRRLRARAATAGSS